jgi:hypothetical protein
LLNSKVIFCPKPNQASLPITNTPDWGPIGQTKELSNNSDFGQFLNQATLLKKLVHGKVCEYCAPAWQEGEHELRTWAAPFRVLP